MTADFRYVFAFGDDNELAFDVDVERPAASGDLPAWTALEFEKCGNCPLAQGRCPAAADLANVVESFKDHLSYSTAEVRVISDERTVSRVCDMQTALASLMGLVMATSGCPHLEPLRPLARFHLPFATREETLFRIVGAHLARQYVRSERGAQADFSLDNLRETYAALTVVNTDFTERLRAAARKDASLNAVVNLFSLAVLISITLEHDLDALALVVGEPAGAG